MEHKRIVAQIEGKAIKDNGTFSGYASVFGFEDYDGDVIMRGAFADSLKGYRDSGKMPKMLWQHNVQSIIGKWLDMHEDERGLFVEGQIITDVQQGREAYALMKEGVLDGMSIGFNIVDAGPNGTHGRVINKLDLWETSLVTWGANPEALITQVKARKSIRDFEAFLRDAGFSRTEAKAVAADGFKAMEHQRDADDQTQAELLKALSNLSQTMRYSQ